MSIAFDAATDGGVVNTATSLTFAHTCSGSNRMLFVSVVAGNTPNTITGVTYNGVAMTKIDSVINGTDRYVYLWYLIAPGAGAFNVVVTSNANELIMATAASYTGVKQSAQPDAHTTNTGTSPVTTSVTTVADNCWTILVGYANGGALTASTGSTFRVQGATFTNPTMFDSNTALTPAGSKSMAVTATGSGTAVCMASFSPNTVFTTSVADTNVSTDTANAFPTGTITISTITDTSVSTDNLLTAQVSFGNQSKNSSSWTNQTKH